MPLACFGAISNVTMLWKHAEGMSLRYGVVVLGDLIYFLLFKDFCFFKVISKFQVKALLNKGTEFFII